MPPEVEELDLSRSAFRVDEWLVEPSLNRVTRGDTTIQLELKVMDVLVCLAGRAGELVTRRDLTDTVWATEFISDNTVSHAVAELRAALGDDAKQPRYIETIHRRGYRLIAAVEMVVPDEAESSKVARFPSIRGAAGAEAKRSPYPGLSAFTEEDAEHFFGREVEVARMWRKLTSRRLLAVIGPSGVGKSSFLRAGVIPAKPEGWGAIVCQPGEGPFGSLARALVPQFGADTDAVTRLVGIRDSAEMVAIVSRWRERHEQALLVVDQFEELFTQNPPEVQAGFAGLLRKLVDDADVHVVLAMRDDFLYRCQALEPLGAILDGLFALEQPDSESLRRALVEPARRQGYAFEDDELAAEMVAEVAGERGALPMLAFAVARLWEKRDRERRLLTREAYIEIGKVGGALAKHAEATLTALGDEKLPIVRELFRNLVTAEGTRAVREWNELLSVFEGSALPAVASKGLGVKDRHSLPLTSERSERLHPSPDRGGQAAEVLRELIDARLLTSYEVREEDRAPARRIEVVHETLLTSWPRLVRWQTQDADAAQLRDQLRQAAKTWDEHGRTDDTLWTGAAYREFASWRERYPGGLTDLEEAFASAMTSLSTRRRRRRRITASAAVVIALVVASVFGILWRRSVLEARRAEAQKLIAMGQLRLEDHPTAAMVYAAASLELRDTDEARLLALRALWQGPTYFVVNDDPSISSEFGPSGEWLVQTLEASNVMHIIGRDGSQRTIERPSETGKTRSTVWFQDHHDLFVSAGGSSDLGRLALWSASKARMLAAGRLEHPFKSGIWVSIVSEDEKPRALVATTEGEFVWIDALYADGRHEQIGQIRLETPISEGSRLCMPCMPQSAPWLALVDGRQVSVVEIGAGGLGMRRLLGTHAEGDPARSCAVDPLGRFVLIPLESGKVEVWDPTGERPPSNFDGPPGGRVEFSRDGSHLIGIARSPDEEDLVRVWFWSIEDGTFRLQRKIEDIKYAGGTVDPERLQFAARGPFPDNRLWPLAGPSSAEPLLLRRGPAGYVQMVAFSPDGKWLATNHKPDGLALWPLVGPLQRIKRMDVNFWVRGPAFGPQGRFLAYVADKTVFVTPLEGAIPAEEHIAYQLQALGYSLAVSPDGTRFAAGGGGGTLWIGADDGAGPTELKGDEDWLASIERVAFSPDGRLVAFLSGFFDLSTARVPVWDLESNEAIASLSLPGEEFGVGVAFVDDGRLLTATTRGVVAWDVRSEKAEVLVEGRIFMFAASPDGRRLVVTEQGPAGMASDPAGPPTYFDLDSGQSTTLSTHGPRVWAVALDPTGEIVVTGDRNGFLRVGPVTGEEPHLLLGHEGRIRFVAIDPLGRWIASAGEDNTVRLWPMPELSKPPLHTLPHEELIAKLKSLTNLRAVRAPESSTGWKIEVGPFPGWAEVPEW